MCSHQPASTISGEILTSKPKRDDSDNDVSTSVVVSDTDTTYCGVYPVYILPVMVDMYVLCVMCVCAATARLARPMPGREREYVGCIASHH